MSNSDVSSERPSRSHASQRAARSPSADRRPTPPSSTEAPRALVRLLQRALHHAVIVINQKWEDVSLTTTILDPAADEDKGDHTRSSPASSPTAWPPPEYTQTVRVEGPYDISVRIRFSVSPLHDDCTHPHPPEQSGVPYEVKVRIAGGPTVRYTTCYPSDSTDDPTPNEDRDAAQPVSPLAILGRKATAFLLRELEKQLGTVVPPSSDASPTADAPRITLDRDGRITHLSSQARTVLEYDDKDPDPNFFSHVDGDNLRRVMSDLARMVRGHLQGARWLIRLQTGSGRWRWYRAVVQNELDDQNVIALTLWPLSPIRPLSS